MGQGVKDGYLGSQTFAVQSKDNDIIKQQQELDAAMSKSPDDGIKKNKELAKKWIETDQLEKNAKDKLKSCNYYLNQAKTLNKIGDEKNDNEAKELAKKLANKINTDFKDVLDKSTKEIEYIDNKFKEAQDKANTQAQKPETIKQDTEDVIKDNNTLLAPLAEKAGVDGNALLNYVVTQLSSLGNKATKNSSNKEKAQKELGDDVILGTSVMICGAIITKDPEKLALIAEKIGTDADKLLKNVNIRKSTKK